MRRFRNWRRRSAALALAPVAAATTIAALLAVGPTAAAEAGGTALDASQNRVGPNQAVTLSGHFSTPKQATAQSGAAAAGGGEQPQSVRIQFRAIGAESWHDAELTATARSGRFSERIVVKRSGRFRAVSSDGRATAPEKVRVRSETQARISEESPVVGERIAVRGHVAPAGSQRKVAVQIGGETMRTQTRADGHFEAEWNATDAGTEAVTVRAAGNRIAAGSSDRAGKVTVFRPAVASYYGPGLYGNPLACGGTLTTSTIGVANKSLPCGTRLTVRYGNREVRTEVVDRGPYVAGREFDLTAALKDKLDFGTTGSVLVSR